MPRFRHSCRLCQSRGPCRGRTPFHRKPPALISFPHSPELWLRQDSRDGAKPRARSAHCSSSRPFQASQRLASQQDWTRGSCRPANGDLNLVQFLLKELNRLLHYLACREPTRGLDREDERSLGLSVSEDSHSARLPLRVLLPPSEPGVRFELDRLAERQLYQRNRLAHGPYVPVFGEKVTRHDRGYLVLSFGIQDEEYPAFVAPEGVAAIALFGEVVPFQVCLDGEHAKPVGKDLIIEDRGILENHHVINCHGRHLGDAEAPDRIGVGAVHTLQLETDGVPSILQHLCPNHLPHLR